MIKKIYMKYFIVLVKDQNQAGLSSLAGFAELAGLDGFVELVGFVVSVGLAGLFDLAEPAEQASSSF